MRERQPVHFLLGFFLGVAACALFWYWQRSTAGAEGALSLLDRLAAAEARLREPGEEAAAAVVERTTREEAEPTGSDQQSEAGGDLLAAGAPAAGTSVNLQQVWGIGPVREKRLRQAGIETYAALAALSQEQLLDILRVNPGQAESIRADARRIAGQPG